MLIVTGGIACGKSQFADVAACLQHSVLDADDWFHLEFKNTECHKDLYYAMFSDAPAQSVAFQHPLWKSYESILAKAFLADVFLQEPDILVIPEMKPFCGELYSNAYVLTIEREDNLSAAITRDAHRDDNLTKLIHENQSSSEERMDRSDYVLVNDCENVLQFASKCEEWIDANIEEVCP